MGFETTQGDTLSCPKCKDNEKESSIFKITRLQGGTLVFRCEECGESVTYNQEVDVDAIIRYASEHLGPTAFNMLSGLFGKGEKDD